jgi:Bacterial PH domain
MNGEYDYEPVPGLPEKLPEGERILWQGAPRWQNLAIDAYQSKLLGVYFALLLAWRIVHGFTSGEATQTILLATGGLLLLAVAALGLLTLLAWLSARTTLYTITNRRVVIRHGIALPMTVNLPFAIIESGALKAAADGHGEIAIALNRDARIGYLLTWPHVRRWHLARPQPALRAIPAVRDVAALLTDAIAQVQGSGLATTPIDPAQGSESESAISLRPRTSVAA